MEFTLRKLQKFEKLRKYLTRAAAAPRGASSGWWERFGGSQGACQCAGQHNKGHWERLETVLLDQAWGEQEFRIHIKYGIFTSCSLSLAPSCWVQLEAHPFILFRDVPQASVWGIPLGTVLSKGTFLHNVEFYLMGFDKYFTPVHQWE